MNRTMILGTILIASAWSVAAIAGEHRSGGHNVNVSTSDEGPIQDCGQIRVQFDGFEAARAEQQLAAPAPSQPLVMRMPASSGLHVTGADRRDITIRACKAARLAEDLSRVSVSLGARRAGLHERPGQRRLARVPAGRGAARDGRGCRGEQRAHRPSWAFGRRAGANV